jgi:predicted transcriptional regulator
MVEARTGAQTHTDGVTIVLDPAQVDQVVRSASGRGATSAVMAGLERFRELLVSNVGLRRLADIEERRLSQSLVCGLFVLASMPTDGSPIAVTDLARVAGMSHSTTHRYLRTLLAVGLVAQDSRTRRYRLASTPTVDQSS